MPAEIFERNVGMESAFQMERGLNALWNQGGIQSRMPILNENSGE